MQEDIRLNLKIKLAFTCEKQTKLIILNYHFGKIILLTGESEKYKLLTNFYKAKINKHTYN